MRGKNHIESEQRCYRTTFGGALAIASAQIAAGIPEIAQQVIDLVDPPRIATFLFALLDPIHGAKRYGTSFFRGQTSRDFDLDALLDMKLELLFEFPFDTISLE